MKFNNSYITSILEKSFLRKGEKLRNVTTLAKKEDASREKKSYKEEISMNF
jgi:hypothetical protein